jgi:hypothetical protein
MRLDRRSVWIRIERRHSPALALFAPDATERTPTVTKDTTRDVRS